MGIFGYLDRIAAEAEARDTRTPEQRAADAAAYEAKGREAAIRLAAERVEFLAAAPRYVLPDGTAWRSSDMMGTLRTGHQGGQGRRLHAVPEEDCGVWSGASPALCGAKPGPRSVGWGDVRVEPVDCPRCMARLRKAGL
ncbi:hypothetical protein [Methylobacterium sp. J-067]|uniref:hypothetical protein n=1 Tax=Methylobacterium sp. J-067 TaxID=2836648 RepID=UPI001FBBA841|nr:hypothetical protein [Methylobacterium sp. J-067]MCJ2025582.1 hypothetical protein [Methylobacterium sp. J-067]